MKSPIIVGSPTTSPCRAAAITRSVHGAVLLVVLAVSGLAHAQGTTLPNGTTLSFDKLYIHEGGSTDAVLPRTDPDSLWHYFNLAHCQCGKAQRDGEVSNFVEDTFEYLVLSMGSPAPIEEPLEIWVGATCSDPTSRVPNGSEQRPYHNPGLRRDDPGAESI